MLIVKRILNLPGKVLLVLLSLYFIILTSFVSPANELVNLTLHDEAYAFVKRLTAKNLIKTRLDTTLPLTRGTIAEMLLEAAEKYHAGKKRPGKTRSDERHLFL